MFLRNKIAYFLIGVTVILDIIWLHFSSIEFTTAGLKSQIIGLFIFITLYYGLNSIYRKRIIKLHHRRKMLLVFINFFQLLFFWKMVFLSAQSLSYLSTTFNRPLIDQHLIKLDHFFHFDMVQFIHCVRAHPFLNMPLTSVYGIGIQLQILFLVFYASIMRKRLMIENFYFYVITTLLISILISILLPVAGPFVGYHYATLSKQNDYLEKFYALRNHTFTTLNVDLLNDGLITFPSFHTILALILAHVWRNISKLVHFLMMVVSMLIILSTITTGWHYIGDVIMGFIVFYGIVAMKNLVSYYSYRKKKSLGF